MTINPVFDETYRQYLKEIALVDLASRAEPLDARLVDGSLLLFFYDKCYRVSAAGIFNEQGRVASPPVRVILSKYVLTFASEISVSHGEGRMMTYRDFKGAAPLVSYFTTNCVKKLVDSFSGKLDDLKRRAHSLGATLLPDTSYDASFLFRALPRIPVELHFNDRDELFEPSCTVLFRESAERYLDMECLAMTGTILASKLADKSVL